MLRILLLLLISAIVLVACSGEQTQLVQNEPVTSAPEQMESTVPPTQPAATASPTATDTPTTVDPTEPANTATLIPTVTDATDPATTTSEEEEHDHDHGVDLTNLPIGDAISSEPAVGSIWSCSTDFRNRHPDYSEAEWIHDDGTYDFLAKLTVDGEVVWPHEFEINLDGDQRIITGNNLPNHPTGEFPIFPDDDAYFFDRNPNAITEQEVRIEIPAIPIVAEQPSCLRLGPIGILLTGGYFFNALDAAGFDAVAYEIQDDCQGHPMSQGAYHYHNLTTCLDEGLDGEHSLLAGYAMDGFGIYGHFGEDGETLTNADLDVCHGHTHVIEWDGEMVEMYHYHATWEYPYTIGCFRG